MSSRSTRLEIVKHAINDVLERLNEQPASPTIRELRTRALAYRNTVERWEIVLPSEESRAALVSSVIELNLEVMRLGRLPAAAS